MVLLVGIGTFYTCREGQFEVRCTMRVAKADWRASVTPGRPFARARESPRPQSLLFEATSPALPPGPFRHEPSECAAPNPGAAEGTASSLPGRRAPRSH